MRTSVANAAYNCIGYCVTHDGDCYEFFGDLCVKPIFSIKIEDIEQLMDKKSKSENREEQIVAHNLEKLIKWLQEDGTPNKFKAFYPYRDIMLILYNHRPTKEVDEHLYYIFETNHGIHCLCEESDRLLSEDRNFVDNHIRNLVYWYNDELDKVDLELYGGDGLMDQPWDQLVDE